MDILIPALAALVVFSLYKKIYYRGRKKIGKEEAKKKIREEKAVLLDVRTAKEYQAGHIKGSKLMSLHTIKSVAPKKISRKDQPVIVYCESGSRSMKAVKILSSLGYTDVYDFGRRANW
ncbi:rhodanese-like domain-containing protein [Clostridia bacterium]|nr:rhodanese-like domain-containing protein [Clostridia bacterium]